MEMESRPNKEPLASLDVEQGVEAASEQCEKVQVDGCLPLLHEASSGHSNSKGITKLGLVELMQPSLEVVECNQFAFLAACLTVVILMFNHCQVHSVGHHSSDLLLEVVLHCSLVVFAFEFVVLCSAKVGYCMSIWFPLDMLATLTLVMDLPWFQRFAFSDDCTMFSTPERDYAAHVGGETAHALRVARVLRLLRLARLVKVFKLVYVLACCMRGRKPQRNSSLCVRKLFIDVGDKLPEQLTNMAAAKTKSTDGFRTICSLLPTKYKPATSAAAPAGWVQLASTPVGGSRNATMHSSR